MGENPDSWQGGISTFAQTFDGKLLKDKNKLISFEKSLLWHEQTIGDRSPKRCPASRAPTCDSSFGLGPFSLTKHGVLGGFRGYSVRLCFWFQNQKQSLTHPPNSSPAPAHRGSARAGSANRPDISPGGNASAHRTAWTFGPSWLTRSPSRSAVTSGAIHASEVSENGWPLPLPPPIGCNLSTNRKRKPSGGVALLRQSRSALRRS